MMELFSPRRSKREKRLVFSNFKPSEMKKQVYNSTTQHVFMATDSDVSTILIYTVQEKLA